jgi:hypothetical protein
MFQPTCGSSSGDVNMLTATLKQQYITDKFIKYLHKQTHPYKIVNTIHAYGINK